MNRIGERIRHIRKINEMTQIEFSALVGIAQGTLSEIEKGNGKPSVDIIYEMKKHFQIDLEWLIMGNASNQLEETLEYEMLQKFRDLDPLIKSEVMEFLEFKRLRLKSEL
jgi:transcriptional regulator with XRE-family HTH domain